MGGKVRKHCEKHIEEHETVALIWVITTRPCPVRAGGCGAGLRRRSPVGPTPPSSAPPHFCRPRPTGARRAHAARRPRSRGVAQLAPESPRFPPTPEVTLAGLPSNSRRVEAAPRDWWPGSAGSVSTKQGGWGRTGQGPPSSLPGAPLGPPAPPAAGRFPEEPRRHRWVLAL